MSTPLPCGVRPLQAGAFFIDSCNGLMVPPQTRGGYLIVMIFSGLHPSVCLDMESFGWNAEEMPWSGATLVVRLTKAFEKVQL